MSIDLIGYIDGMYDIIILIISKILPGYLRTYELVSLHLDFIILTLFSPVLSTLSIKSVPLSKVGHHTIV